MPKLERKIEIDSTPEKIYKIVTDGFNTPRWNPTVTALTPMEGDIIQLETDLGPLTIVKTDHDINKSTVWHMENSNMNSFGYILTPKKEKETEVTIWTEFDDKKLSKLYKKTTDKILEGLQRYVDFIEKGGNPDQYKKWEVYAIP